MATTRAIRRFRPDPIPDDDLSSILWHATRAPTGSNRQPVRYLVLRDGPRATQAKALLGEAFISGWNEKRRHDGYERGTGADPSSPKSRVAAAMQRFVDEFAHTPVVGLACLQLGHYRADQMTSGGSVYPACQNLLLAARALGYGGVLAGSNALVDVDLHALLDIPPPVFI